MHRYVITPDVALSLAAHKCGLAEGVQLLAPTLLRSQVLATLYGRVRSGEMSRADARDVLDYIRGLRMRLLGDRVLQNVAWEMASVLEMSDTFDAEYIALTKLQADALVTDDVELREAASTLVTVAPLDVLLR